MTTDLFDSVLDLEEKFYREGYDAGVADGEHAGLVEGKLFGIEKGYEKAFELGRLRGRAIVWQQRLPNAKPSRDTTTRNATAVLARFKAASLPENVRLMRNVENIMALSDAAYIVTDNSNEAVADFDDRLAKARMKAKIISNVVGEAVEVDASGAPSTGVEDAKGLSART